MRRTLSVSPYLRRIIRHCYFVIAIWLFAAPTLAAQTFKIDGSDTLKVSQLIAAGKKLKLAYKGKDLLKLADTLERVGKAADSKVALLYASLYRSHSYWTSSNYTQSLKYALAALSQSQKWQIYNKLPEIYNAIGTVYKENLDYPKAFDAIGKAVQAARDLNDTVAMIVNYRTQAMFMHGYAFNDLDTSTVKGKKMLRDSYALHLKGLKLAQTDPKFEISSIGNYNNIAQYHLETKDYKKAIAMAEQGMALGTKYKQYRSLTYSYTWLGKAYFQQGQKAKGIALLRKALDLCKEHQFIFREMEVYNDVEECYVAMGDYKNAWQAKSRWEAIADSLSIINNVQKLDELNVRYQTAEKNARIRLLDQSARQKNLLFIGGIGIMLLLGVFVAILYYQKKKVKAYNLSLIASNRTVSDQAIKLETLLKELHHRVKNNLQIVTSLLKLQSNRLTDQDAIYAIRDSQQRIEAMSLIHRTLYQQEDSSLVNMKQFITELVTSIMSSFGLSAKKVDFKLQIDVNEMDIDLALPLGLIINELIINSIKHAYHDNADMFRLMVKLNCATDCKLEVSDNGPGVSPAVWENPQNSFGIKLIKLLTIQLGGKSELTSNNGTHFKLEILNKA